MKKKLTSNLKRYYKQINAIIPKNYPHREEVISAIHRDISSYAGERSECSYDDILEHFGTPEEMALSFAETLSAEDLVSSSRKQRKRILVITSAIIIVFVCILAVLIPRYFLLTQNKAVGIEEVITIYEEVEESEGIPLEEDSTSY